MLAFYIIFSKAYSIIGRKIIDEAPTKREEMKQWPRIAGRLCEVSETY